MTLFVSKKIVMSAATATVVYAGAAGDRVGSADPSSAPAAAADDSGDSDDSDTTMMQGNSANPGRCTATQWSQTTFPNLNMVIDYICLGSDASKYSDAVWEKLWDDNNVNCNDMDTIACVGKLGFATLRDVGCNPLTAKENCATGCAELANPTEFANAVTQCRNDPTSGNVTSGGSGDSGASQSNCTLEGFSKMSWPEVDNNIYEGCLAFDVTDKDWLQLYQNAGVDCTDDALIKCLASSGSDLWQVTGANASSCMAFSNQKNFDSALACCQDSTKCPKTCSADQWNNITWPAIDEKNYELCKEYVTANEWIEVYMAAKLDCNDSAMIQCLATGGNAAIKAGQKSSANMQKVCMELKDDFVSGAMFCAAALENQVQLSVRME